MTSKIKKIGIDIGGHTLTIAEVSDFPEPHIVDKKTVNTVSPRTPETLINSLSLLVREYVNDGEKCCIGLAVPGALDKQKKFCYLTNFGNVKCNLSELLALELANYNIIATVKAENDANAVAIGEKIAGQAKKLEDFICVTLGTGVGGGIFSNNHLVTGAHGLAGELGHIFLDDKVKDCPCGGKGHLEAFVGAYTIENETKALGIADNFKELWKKRMRCEKAYEITSVFLDRIASAFATYIAILDPEVIFLYGGISKSEGIIQEIYDRLTPLLSAEEKEKCKILLSTLEENAAIFGVALGL